MFKREMTEKQLAEKNLFVEKVTAAGWDIGTSDQLLESDLMSVSPEGYAEYQNPKANLELSYHAPESYIALLIGSKDLQDSIKFRCYYGTHLAEALDAIIEAQATLSHTDFTKLIEKLLGLCEGGVFIEKSEKELIKVSL
jgi:hypothetical protein